MINSSSQRSISILLVEDNPGDVRLVQESFREWRIFNSLHVVKDGVEALAYLRNQEPFNHVERPDLILLDLNLPRKNGSEVLAEIKNDPALKRIPVIILTASQAEEDILRAYDLYANCYIVKSIDFNDFMKAINAVKHFWLNIVQLPEE